MEFSNEVIFFGALLFLVSILASVVSARLGLPVLLVFLVIGMLAGAEGLGGIAFDNVQLAHLIGSLALAIILFDGGLRTEFRNFRVGLRPALVLATAGVVMTAVVMALFAVWVFDLSWYTALLLGAIVGSTDAAAVFSLMHSRGLEIKQRVAATLEIESGSNDPMAIFLTVVLVEAVVAGQAHAGWFLLREFVVQMGVGAVAGIVGGVLLAWLVNQVRLGPGLYPLLVLSGGLLVFGLAAAVGGSGFLAIYIAGLMVGNRRLQSGRNIRRFHHDMAWLSQISMFLILGLLVVPTELLDVALYGVASAAVLILVARPLAVALCLLPFRFSWREQVFIAWTGLRGAVPIILALFPLLAGIEDAGLLFNVAFFVVLISLLVQGSTINTMARWLRVEVPPETGVFHRLELDLPGQPEHELVSYRVHPGSAAANRSLDQLSLPPNIALSLVIRGVELLNARQVDALVPGDYVYFLAPAGDLKALDNLFVELHVPERLQPRRFFGEFVINADARLDDLAGMYDLDLPNEASGFSAGELLHRRFGRPVVGDRVRLGPAELVVREMAGNQVSRVGLKLLE